MTANKRMFSRDVVESARFLKMPISAQLLYFHLGIDADDDGIVEAYKVLRMLDYADDDLKTLESRGFVKILNDDLVTYIVDWLKSNNLRSDRKKDSIYLQLLLETVPGVEIAERKEDSTKKKKHKNDSQMTAKCQTNGSQMPDKCLLSIEENSIDKSNIDEWSIEEHFSFLKSIYPKNTGLAEAKVIYEELMDSTDNKEELQNQIIQGIYRMNNYIKEFGVEIKTVKSLKLFLEKESYKDDYPKKEEISKSYKVIEDDFTY